jgi:hypothetical protein
VVGGDPRSPHDDSEVWHSVPEPPYEGAMTRSHDGAGLGYLRIAGPRIHWGAATAETLPGDRRTASPRCAQFGHVRTESRYLNSRSGERRVCWPRVRSAAAGVDPSVYAGREEPAGTDLFRIQVHHVQHLTWGAAIDDRVRVGGDEVGRRGGTDTLVIV